MNTSKPEPLYRFVKASERRMPSQKPHSCRLDGHTYGSGHYNEWTKTYYFLFNAGNHILETNLEFLQRVEWLEEIEVPPSQPIEGDLKEAFRSWYTRNCNEIGPNCILKPEEIISWFEQHYPSRIKELEEEKERLLKRVQAAEYLIAAYDRWDTQPIGKDKYRDYVNDVGNARMNWEAAKDESEQLNNTTKTESNG